MKMEEFDSKDRREEIYSKVVRAGKRTYFFDVKATRSNEYYLTITESKRRFSNEQGKYLYEKHKLFLYKEDFDKFSDGFSDAIEYIKKNNSLNGITPIGELVVDPHTNVEFEDLTHDADTEE